MHGVAEGTVARLLGEKLGCRSSRTSPLFRHVGHERVARRARARRTRAPWRSRPRHGGQRPAAQCASSARARTPAAWPATRRSPRHHRRWAGWRARSRSTSGHAFAVARADPVATFGNSRLHLCEPACTSRLALMECRRVYGCRMTGCLVESVAYDLDRRAAGTLRSQIPEVRIHGDGEIPIKLLPAAVEQRDLASHARSRPDRADSPAGSRPCQPSRAKRASSESVTSLVETVPSKSHSTVHFCFAGKAVCAGVLTKRRLGWPGAPFGVRGPAD